MAQRVFFTTSEVYPFSKTGGLGDVMGALPLAMQKNGFLSAVISPFYGRISTSNFEIKLVVADLPVGYPWAPITVDVYKADYYGVPLYFLRRAEYFDRRHYYNNNKGDYFDNAERFIFFCRACMSLMEYLGEPPLVVHAHDWQTSLLPAYLHFARRDNPFWAETGTVCTIHNLAFQGRFSSRLFTSCGLPDEAWHMDGVEFYGDMNMLKAGIAYADAVTTVSPGYAREILTEKFGCGLDGILRKREADLYGILNGAAYDVWDPANDAFLSSTYDAANFSGKEECKLDLMKELGLDPALAQRPILGFVGRFRGQKGIDLLIDIIPELMKLNVGVVALGEGSAVREDSMLELMQAYPGRVHTIVGYTEDLAHRIQAGTDIFLMPSRYEPCGLTQMYALRYGTPPVATLVGGLRDTIVPWPDPQATGFVFSGSTPEAFLDAVRQAVYVWGHDPEGWNMLIRRAMSQAFTWDSSCTQYQDVYNRIRRRLVSSMPNGY